MAPISSMNRGERVSYDAMKEKGGRQARPSKAPRYGTTSAWERPMGERHISCGCGSHICNPTNLYYEQGGQETTRKAYERKVHRLMQASETRPRWRAVPDADRREARRRAIL